MKSNLLDKSLFKSLPSSHLDFVNKLIERGYEDYNIECLYSHDLELVNAVKSYYNIGYDLIPLIEVGDSPWYIKFLLDCVVNRIDVVRLSSMNLSIGNIYNLGCCMVFGYDINPILVRDDLTNLTRKDIVDECLSQERSLGNVDCSLYLVEGGSSNCEEGDDDVVFKSHCILSPSIRFAKLLASVSGSMNPFDCLVKLIDINEPSIIHSSEI